MKKLDELLKKVEYFERLAYYSDRTAFLKAIAQATPTVGGTPEADKYLHDLENPSGTQTTKELVIEGTPPIDKKIQDMLNQLLAVEKSLMLPIPVDGALGKKTRDALNLFSKTFSKPATPAAVAAFYNQKSQSSRVVNLDDAAKQKEEYYKSQSIPPGAPGSRT